MDASLPIDDVLDEITRAYTGAARVTIAAPPGAGKTTRVPLHLLREGLLGGGRLIVLEPRRIAARGAAARMAKMCGEPLGRTIGLSTRLERRVSADTRIEVVTDGLYVRRLLADPGLDEVACVIFDEVHERSLNIDLGLALTLDAQTALRPDLRVVLMSATLETGKVVEQIGGVCVTSEGRAHPVETRYVGRGAERLPRHMARIIGRAVARHDGSILAFLPGSGEIRQTQDLLADAGLPELVDVMPLFGALSPAEQDLAIRPADAGRRKIVLATDIAESALTIEGVSTVIDCGLVRVPIAGPGMRSGRLATERASRASVDQRRGRAGRTGPGVCYRLWDEAETRGLRRDVQPEILRADLSSLVLDLAEWGETEPGRLTWLDPPPQGRLEAARAELLALGALGEDGRQTELGRKLAKLPLPPVLGVLVAGASNAGDRALGAEIAALLSERGLGGKSADLATRLERFRRDTGLRARAMRRQADRWGGGSQPPDDAGAYLARAWPDAIARRQPNGAFLTVAGQAVTLADDAVSPGTDWIVVAEAMGSGPALRAVLMAPVLESDVFAVHRPETLEKATFNPRTATFSARRVKAIGAIILSEQPLPKPSGAAARAALISAIQSEGWATIRADLAIAASLARFEFAAKQGAAMPDWTAQTLAETAGEWLIAADTDRVPSPGEVTRALLARLDWPARQALQEAAPEHLTLPSGRKALVDYLDAKAPLVTGRVQEFFGPGPHPALGPRAVPVTLALTSPAGRPAALTSDLEGFWRGGYADMAKDMRARYPKHDWPDAPNAARPHAGHTKSRLAKGSPAKRP
ncbi:MAG: ATP-dependent helicase HrpB [Pseudomonadota bacterium]